MKIIISNKIYLIDWPDGLKNTIKSGLTLPNPLFWVLKRKGNIRALYAIKKEFKYYSEINNILAIPRGSLDTLKLFICNKGLDCKLEYNLCQNKLEDRFRANESFAWRNYQVGVIDEIIKQNNGVLKLDTAFGKTLVALKLVETLQLATLIVVPRSSILSQFIEESKQYFDYEPGIIQGTKWKIKDITIASISTLQQRDLKDIKDKFGMVIVDECFDGEMQILTINGRKKIKDILIGEKIINVIGIDIVTNVIKKRVDSLLCVKFTHQVEILITENHPILTINGWKSVGSLNFNDIILTYWFSYDIMNLDIKSLLEKYGKRELFNLWKSTKNGFWWKIVGNMLGYLSFQINTAEKTSSTINICKKEIERESGVFSKFREEISRVPQKTSRDRCSQFYKNEEKESYDESRDEKKIISNNDCKRASSRITGREWIWINYSTENIISSTWSWLGSRAINIYKGYKKLLRYFSCTKCVQGGSGKY